MSSNERLEPLFSKMFGGNRTEQFFNILKDNRLLKLVDKDQHEHVFFGIFLLTGGRRRLFLRNY